VLHVRATVSPSLQNYHRRSQQKRRENKMNSAAFLTCVFLGGALFIAVFNLIFQ
jgi:hypothetical protein